MGADGSPVIIYEDSGNTNLGIPDSAHYYTNGVNTVISSNGLGNSYTLDAALGPDGFARVALLNNQTGADLIQCQDAICSTRSTNSVIFSGGVGAAVSVVVGSDGNAIMQGGSQAGTIDYFRCTKTNCSRYTDDLLPGTWENTGLISLATDVDGFARMIAQRGTNVVSQVKVGATPVNFKVTNVDDATQGTLPPMPQVFFSWESSTGKLKKETIPMIGKNVVLLAVLLSMAQVCKPQSEIRFEDAETAVRNMLRHTGGYTGSDVKNLSRLGDASAVAITKILGGDTVSPEQVNQVLVILSLSFQAPKGIASPGDRDPRTTMFLLKYLECSTSDPTLRQKIADTRASLQSRR